MKVGVVGTTGYTAAELIRWLLLHPDIELTHVVSSSRPGQPLDDIHPGLAGLTQLETTPFEPAALAELDAVLLGVPHGAAKGLVTELNGAKARRILDLSSDHRHADGWVYGMAEWSTSKLQNATRVAVPGCFATAISMACAPFVASGRVCGPVRTVAATGSTGLGAKASSAGHHPERFVNLKGYKVLSHQHGPEITTFLRGVGGFEELKFVPWSAPLDRGILATSFIPMKAASSQEVKELLEGAYHNAPLVRVRDSSPEIRRVRGTAFCDIFADASGEDAVVISAIDNLGKGAASQAIQCLNLTLGLPVHRGLQVPPLLP
jgi:N-acetyl-gamma-glutamyl-phosphate reductase common form